MKRWIIAALMLASAGPGEACVLVRRPLDEDFRRAAAVVAAVPIDVEVQPPQAEADEAYEGPVIERIRWRITASWKGGYTPGSEFDTRMEAHLWPDRCSFWSPGAVRNSERILFLFGSEPHAYDARAADDEPVLSYLRLNSRGVAR